ncbi:YcxB family protein [Cyclobacterium xiamenense]|uniref:YcxB family protein n=1 Tax=Cyclobacterium xiamenense TaxID=1297121 RepID=UPI0035CEEB2F
MIVKTKKYKLETGTYIKQGLVNIFKEQWWVALIALAIACGYFWIASWWWISMALLAYALYWLFWVIQFAGVTQMEQNKVMFEKLSYEIDSRQVMMKINSKQGMPIKWEMIKKAQIKDQAYILVLSKAQFIHLPFKIFHSQNEIKFVETILKRKGLVA